MTLFVSAPMRRHRQRSAHKPVEVSVMIAAIVFVILLFGLGGIFVAFYSGAYCASSASTTDITNITDAMRLDTTVHPIIPPVEKKVMRVHFAAAQPANCPIKFVPLQPYIDVIIGEPTLTFFLGMNSTSETFIGIPTYSTSPEELGQYFAKIQCFCFEEQRFRPREVIELPVFFCVDPAIKDDPIYAKFDHVMVSYSIFPLSTRV